MIAELIGGRRIEVPCTVAVEHTNEFLHAEVTFAEDVDVRPGDAVYVHGDPIQVPYGERLEEQRHATVVHAGWLERAWTRLTGRLEVTELLEFSFSPRRTL